MRRILLCCAVLTQALRLELDVDGRRLHLEYEESNLWEARFRYAVASTFKVRPSNADCSAFSIRCRA